MLRGGLIEAMPTSRVENSSSPALMFRIEPDGNVVLLGSYDKIQGTKLVNFACVFPQASLPSINLKQVVATLGESLYAQGVFGYITLEMLAFQENPHQKSHPLFWMIDLKCQLDEFSASYFLFDFLSHGRLDKVSGQYFLTSKDTSNILPDQQDFSQSLNIEEAEERCFMFAPYLFHQGLSNQNYRDFFQLCRKNQISYDLEKKSGVVFLLSGELN